MTSHHNSVGFYIGFYYCCLTDEQESIGDDLPIEFTCNLEGFFEAECAGEGRFLADDCRNLSMLCDHELV